MRLNKKREQVSLFCARLSVNLHIIFKRLSIVCLLMEKWEAEE